MSQEQDERGALARETRRVQSALDDLATFSNRRRKPAARIADATPMPTRSPIALEPRTDVIANAPLDQFDINQPNHRDSQPQAESTQKPKAPATAAKPSDNRVNTSLQGDDWFSDQEVDSPQLVDDESVSFDEPEKSSKAELDEIFGQQETFNIPAADGSTTLSSGMPAPSSNTPETANDVLDSFDW